MNKPTPRLLLLRLLMVAEANTLSASEAVLAGSIFGMTENSIRVTLARLIQADLAESIGPATYKLGPAVFKANDFDEVRQKKARALWSDMHLEKHYKEQSKQLTDWLSGLEELPSHVALREIFMLGDAGIRSVVFDPLLPAPLVDEDARQKYFETVRCINEEGRRLWFAFFEEVKSLESV